MPKIAKNAEQFRQYNDSKTLSFKGEPNDVIKSYEVLNSACEPDIVEESLRAARAIYQKYGIPNGDRMWVFDKGWRPVRNGVKTGNGRRCLEENLWAEFDYDKSSAPRKAGDLIRAAHQLKTERGRNIFHDDASTPADWLLYKQVLCERACKHSDLCIATTARLITCKAILNEQVIEAHGMPLSDFIALAYHEKAEQKLRGKKRGDEPTRSEWAHVLFQELAAKHSRFDDAWNEIPDSKNGAKEIFVGDVTVVVYRSDAKLICDPEGDLIKGRKELSRETVEKRYWRPAKKKRDSGTP